MNPIIFGFYHDPVTDSIEKLEILKMKYYDTGWECVARYYPNSDDFNDNEYFKMDLLNTVEFRGFTNE